MSPARRSPDPFQPTRCCCYFRILLKPAYFSRDHSRLGRLSPTEESSYHHHHHHHNFWLPPRRTRSATRSQQSSERSTLSDAYCFSYEACSHQEPSSATRSEDILAVTSNPLVGGERDQLVLSRCRRCRPLVQFDRTGTDVELGLLSSREVADGHATYLTTTFNKTLTYSVLGPTN